MSDIRHAFRLLAKAPLFTAISVATLAIGIGSVAVVFAAINALTLRPLPHLEDEDRIVALTQQRLDRGLDDLGTNFADLRDWVEQSITLEGIFYHSDLTIIFTDNERPRRYLGNQISANTFDLLGVPPLLGRNLTPADAVDGAPPVALISHAVWQERFAGAPDVLGSVVPLNGVPTTIVGIMPAGWRYPEFSDVWLPFPSYGKTLSLERGEYYLDAGARLRSGVTLAAAQAEADRVMATLAERFPKTNGDVTLRVRPFRDPGSAGPRHLTLLLLGAVLSIFLIACANVAHLQLARCTSRTPELALRLALGASRARIIRQILAESIVLALVGGAAGALAGLWGIDWMVAAIPRDLPFWLVFSPDTRVFGLILLCALVAGVGLGIVPALRLSRWQIVECVKQGDRLLYDRSGTGTRLRYGLVVAQIALALVLLIGAALMLRSYDRLRKVEPGFQTDQVLTFRVGLPGALSDLLDSRDFIDQIQARLTALPTVTAAAAISQLPGLGRLPQVDIALLDRSAHPADKPATASARTVTAGFFHTLQIPLLRGRDFDANDRPDAPPVAIVDTAFAQRYFGGDKAALGQQFRAHYRGGTRRDGIDLTIVGIVAPIRQRLERDESLPAIYVPHLQRADNTFMSFVARTTVDPYAIVEAAQAEVLSVQAAIPIYHVLSLSDVLLRSPGVWTHHFFSRLFSAAGIIALFLACIGIYGVMSIHVADLRHEIGVRMALGAPANVVVRNVVWRGLRLVAWGLGAGVVSAALLANSLGGVLYGIKPHDPPTFLLVPLLLAVVALLTCYLPTRRATRIDPIAALRAD